MSGSDATVLSPLRLTIVCPSCAPAPGGGAVYYRLLAEGLAGRGLVDRVEILTEAHPGCPNAESGCEGRLRLRRLYPYRTARARRHWLRFPAYLWENLLFLGLLLRRWRPHDVLLVHSSFHHHPNLLGRVIALLALRRSRPRLVSDVRDPRLPRRRFRELDSYDAIIACARSCAEHLRRDPALAVRLVEIPIPFEVRRPEPEAVAATLARHGLEPGGYLLWTNGIQRTKNIDLAIQAMRRLRRARPELTLAVAGRRRDWSADHAKAEAEGTITYLGTLEPDEVLALDAGAALVLNLSEIEGMPRAALEAMALEAPVILPPNVPEFEGESPEHVARIESPEALADQILKALDGSPGAPRYALERHAPGRVLPLYRDLFLALVEGRGASSRG